MSHPFFSFFSQLIGAFVVWAYKGFKGGISDHMAAYGEFNDIRWRNIFISFALIIGIGFIVKGCKYTGPENDSKEIIYEIQVDNK